MLDNELLQAISGMMDEKLISINGRLDKMDGRLDKMDGRLDKMDGRLDKMDGRLDKMDGRLDKLESQVSALKTGQSDLRRELKEVNVKVSNTYQLALETWGMSSENRRWLETGRA